MLFICSGRKVKVACDLCLFQTFLRVRANRHTRLSGTCRRCMQSVLTVVRRRCRRFSTLCSHRCDRFCVSPPTPSPVFSAITHIARSVCVGLAPTRAEELLTFQLWPLDMLTVDDLCWCRCYVKSAPLRPHSAGAHLDCTQAGKTRQEELPPSSAIMSSAFAPPSNKGFKIHN